MNYKTRQTSKRRETRNLDSDRNGSILMIDPRTHTHNSRYLFPQQRTRLFDLMKNRREKNRRDGINLWASVRGARWSVKSTKTRNERRAKNDNVILIYDSEVEIVMNISGLLRSAYEDDEEFQMTFRVRHLSWGGKVGGVKVPKIFQFDFCLGWLKRRGEWGSGGFSQQLDEME